MDSVLMELQIIGSNFLNMPISQQIALGLVIFLTIIFNMSASASYSKTINGVEKKIEKTRNWPGNVIKLIWIATAIAVSNYWIAFVVVVATYVVVFSMPGLWQPLLLKIQPKITEKEKKKLENSF
jgi:hypothetical protein